MNAVNSGLSCVTYRLLEAFRAVFEGKRYQHRDSSQGDRVSYELYEDLYVTDTSRLFVDRVDRRSHVLCVENRRRGIDARRGDGTFGAVVPGVRPWELPGAAVARGEVANVQIGVEAKILAKAMIKQIDRVISDLRGQVDQFRKGGDRQPICVGIVGINQAQVCSSYEGRIKCPSCGAVFPREHVTTGGSGSRHPDQEAAEAESRLRERARPAFDEFLILRYRATNQAPYPFEWVDYEQAFRDYGAILIRIADMYRSRFGVGGLSPN